MDFNAKMYKIMGEKILETGVIALPRRSSSKILLRWLLAFYILSAVLISYLPAGANISQSIGVLLAFAFVVNVLVEKRRILLTRELVILGLFAIYTLIGAFLARDLAAFWTMEATLFQLIVLIIIIYDITRNETSRLLSTKVFVLAVTIASVLALLGVGFSAEGRIGGVLGNPNNYGATLLFAIALAGYLLSTRLRRWQRVLLIIVIAWLSWNVLLSGSRTAILGLVVFVGALLLLYTSRMVTKRPFRVIMTWVVLAGVLTVGFSSIFNLDLSLQRRLDNVWLAVRGTNLQALSEGSLVTRYRFIQTAFQVWKEQPLLGVGTNQFRYYATEYNPNVFSSYAHSDYAEILADFGLIGFLLYYVFFFLLSMRVLRLRVGAMAARQAISLDIVTAFLLSFFVSEVGFVLYYSKVAWIGFALILCLLQTWDRKGYEGNAY